MEPQQAAPSEPVNINARKFVVETSDGKKYQVEVDSQPAAPGPSSSGFLQNVVTSGVDLAKGAVEGVRSMIEDPPGTTAVKMGQGLIDRVKSYAGDIHPKTAADPATGGNPNNAAGLSMLGLSPLAVAGANKPAQTLSNLLPVGMAYKDPVGVAADVSGAYGLAKGVAGVAGKFGGPRPIEAPIQGALESLRPAPNSPTLASNAKPPTMGDGAGAVYSGRSGAWSPEMEGRLVQGGFPAPLEDSLSSILREAMQPQSVELAPSHPIGGGFTTPPPSNPNAGGTLTTGSGGPPQLNTVLDGLLKQAMAPEQPRLTTAAPEPTVAGAGHEPTIGRAGKRPLVNTTSGRPSTVRPGPVDAPAPMASHAEPAPTAPAMPEAEQTLAEVRRLLGSDRAARDPRFVQAAQESGIPATKGSVQDLTGGPHQTPLEVEGAGLDRDYARRIADDRGFVNPDILTVLETLLTGYLAGQVGSKVGAVRAVNRVGGVAAPSILGAAGAARLNAPTPVPSH